MKKLILGATGSIGSSLAKKIIAEFKNKLSSKNNQAISAETGGIKKNKLDVLLAEPILIKYINIVKAPNDTAKICQLIDKINVELKLINGFSNRIITINKKILAPTA